MAKDKQPKILDSLSAGRHPLIHIIDQNESLVRIQDAEDPGHYVDIFKNALPTFIELLQRVSQKVNRS